MKKLKRLTLKTLKPTLTIVTMAGNSVYHEELIMISRMRQLSYLFIDHAQHFV